MSATERGDGRVDLPLACSNCGKDLTDGIRGRDWENYDGLMVACADCLAKAGEQGDRLRNIEHWTLTAPADGGDHVTAKLTDGTHWEWAIGPGESITAVAESRLTGAVKLVGDARALLVAANISGGAWEAQRREWMARYTDTFGGQCETAPASDEERHNDV